MPTKKHPMRNRVLYIIKYIFLRKPIPNLLESGGEVRSDIKLVLLHNSIPNQFQEGTECRSGARKSRLREGVY